MLNSRSTVFRNSTLWAFGVWLALVMAPSLAVAKRIVVLEFTGEDAAAFQADVIKQVKKAHSVVPAEKWEAAAEKASATRINSKNVKKVARKLGVDAVVQGQVEKRRERYILRVKVRSAATGEYQGTGIEVISSGPTLDARSTKELRDELLELLDTIEEASGEDDGGTAAPTGVPPPADTSTSTLPAPEPGESKSKDKSKDKGKGKGKVVDDQVAPLDTRTDVSAAEPDEPTAESAGKNKRKKRKPRSQRDDSDAEDDESDAPTRATARRRRPTPGAIASRAAEFSLGMSVSARRLTFRTAPDLVNDPQGYRGSPVAGAILEVDVYPMAFNKKRSGFLRNLGFTAVMDRVIKISSTVRYDSNGSTASATLGTTQQRMGAGLVVRHPFGNRITSPVIYAKIRYNRMEFSIDKSDAPDGVVVDVPNVRYGIIDPGLGFRFPFSRRLSLGMEASALLFTTTGPIQLMSQYGSASVTGFSGEAMVDVGLTDRIFLRAGGQLTMIGFTFEGNGVLATDRDGLPDVDVSGARDLYYNGMISLGYSM